MDARIGHLKHPGIYPDACALRSALDQGATTARAALEACFDAIDRLNGQVNAVVYQDRSAALAAADACDRASSPVGPLHGVPITIKESFDWHNHPTTWGDPDRTDHRAHKDSRIAQLLKQAGAVIFGKTNVPPYLADWETDNPLFGATRNPIDPDLSCGGSSGGSAAAVACGFSYLDIGSDGGGSIRLPAHYCGVHGLKPSWGAISLRGHSALNSLREPDISVAGPLARSPRDIRLAFSILAQQQLDSEFAQPDRPLLVAVLPEQPLCPVDTAYRVVIDRFLDELRESGHEITFTMPDFDIARATELMNLLVRAETAPNAPLIARMKERRGAPQTVSNAYAQLNQRGAALSHLEWLALHEERLRLCEQMDAFFENYDLFLVPAAASAAAPLRTGVDVTERTVPVNGQEEPVLKQHLLYMFASLCYLPSFVIPIGETASGLPVGLQFVGPIGRDQHVIALSSHLAGVSSMRDATA